MRVLIFFTNVSEKYLILRRNERDMIKNIYRSSWKAPLRLRLLCGVGGYPPNVLQSTEAYCINPTLGSPFISRDAPHQTKWEASISERRNYGREMSDQILPTIAISTVIVAFFYMPHSYDMGPTALLHLRKKACWGIFRPKNPTAGFKPAKSTPYSCLILMKRDT
jgi:hypothetical protein